jgi:hypothetical protein
LIVFYAVVGAGMLAAGIGAWLDHRVLQERGVVATAQIMEVHYKGKGTRLTVQFTTVAGERIVADLSNPSTMTTVQPGATMQLRYDRDDPAGRVADANADQAVSATWLLVVGGAGMLTAAGYGSYRGIRAQRHH